MPIIVDKGFIMTGDMETNPMEKLDDVQYLKIPLFPLMQF